MTRARALAAVVAVVALLALAAPVAAADPVTVSGTVTAEDGSPAAGVQVTLLVRGSDQIVPATTDQDGAFSAQVEAGVDDVVDIAATGTTVTSEPDASGCVKSSTPTGRASVTIGEQAPDPVTVVLDTVLESTVCSTTATPDATGAATPPATDLAGPGSSGPRGPGLPVLLSLLAALCAGSLVVSRRRPRRRTVRRRA